MPSGGYRPGAGRPRGSGNGKAKAKAPTASAAKPARLPGATVAEARRLPLAYLLDVMNDPEADVARRDRMAIAAAPFMHDRFAFVANRGDAEPHGKKAQANSAAVTAQAGTAWEDILPPASVQ